MIRAVGLVLLLVGAAASDAAEKKSPIMKVIEMMNDMMSKAKEEKQAEKVRFAAFSQFCGDTTEQKKVSIEKGEADVERAAANIAEAEAAAKSLAKEIARHEKDVGIWASDKEKALELRGEEHRNFNREHTAASDSVEATVEAKKVLEEGNEDAAQAALVQLGSKTKLSSKADHVIKSYLNYNPAAALLQDEAGNEGEAMGAPQAKAFEGQSGQVIEVVEDLGDKSRAFLRELENTEALQLNAHNLMVNSLEGDMKKAKMMVNQKASVKAEKEQEKAEAKGDLADSTNSLAEDKKYLADLNAECELKTTDFQKRQVMRQEEIEAIMKAIDIMSSTKGSAQLVQQKAAVSLAQLRNGLSSQEMARQKSAQHRAASFLAARAKAMKSQVLSFIASKALSGPFDKVTKMVKDMIAKLMTEANEEAEQKGFCDTEMGTNKMTRDNLSAEVAELDANMEQLTADINELSQRSVSTQEAIKEIDAAVTKAMEERQAEKEKNQGAIEDAKVAQGATQNALQVLKDYYEKAANQVDLPEAEGPIKYDPRSLQILSKSAGGALVQQGQRVPGAPEMESGKYTGMENGGVVGMLEIIGSDFADLIAETTQSEAEAVRVFEQFTTDSAQDKAVKETELQHLQATQTEKSSDLTTARQDQRSTQRELQAAMDYYEKLKPDCVEKATSYEDKTAARKQEIDSLKEALTILTP